MAWPAAGFTQWNAGTVNGPQSVPTSSAPLEAVLLWLAGAVFTNTAGVNRKVTVTDTAGNRVLNTIDVPPDGIPTVIEFPLMPMTGLKWFADGAGVIGCVWGNK